VVATPTIVTIGSGLLLGGSVALAWWWFTWDKWEELRSDWRDFRTAADYARANTRERAAFASGKRCGRCRHAVNPRRLYRAVRTGYVPAPPSSWVYRCPCGESTLFDGTGATRPVEPASAA
jgi:hypothetical protein